MFCRSKIGKKFTAISLSILAVVIVFSTYLHFFKPETLHVPSNTDVSSWKMTPFEQTWIYDRMNDAEREKYRVKEYPVRNIQLLLYEILPYSAPAVLCPRTQALQPLDGYGLSHRFFRIHGRPGDE